MNHATGDAAIRSNGLGYSYAGAARPAVHDVSFTVSRGEIFGFLGPSGAGKSTTQKLLFLDEPTAGLDPVTARRIRQVIRDARAGGATIFLTTHDMTTADELCDRVAFLVDGRIAAIDAPRALRLAHGRRAVRVEAIVRGQRTSREFPLQGLAANPAFLAALEAEHIETIHTTETTLEDVFVLLTGRHLA